MAGLGIAFVSSHAIAGELRTGQLSALRLRGHRIRRHFHVIHNQARTLGASARAFTDLLEDAGRSGRAAASRGKVLAGNEAYMREKR